MTIKLPNYFKPKLGLNVRKSERPKVRFVLKENSIFFWLFLLFSLSLQQITTNVKI